MIYKVGKKKVYYNIDFDSIFFTKTYNNFENILNKNQQ